MRALSSDLATETQRPKIEPRDCPLIRHRISALLFLRRGFAGAGNPFDRMLAAQSESEEIPIATNDPQIEIFGLETIW